MPLGPVFRFEMLTGARRARYFLLRVFYASILLALMWINYQSVFGWSSYSSGNIIRQSAEFSSAFFVTFSIFQIVAVVVLTPAMIAGVIAQERERRTLEYLLTSQLTNLGIVVAKFGARVTYVAYVLLVGLPVLSIMTLFGGVGVPALLMTFLLTMTTLLAAASLSIAVSVWAPRSRDAVTRTYALLLMFLLVPPLAAQLGAGLGVDYAWLATVCKPLIAINSFFVLSQFLMSFQLGGDAWSTFRDVALPAAGGHLIVSAALVGFAVLTVRRAYVRSMGRGKGSGRLGRYNLWLRWRPGLGDRPMLWKELFADAASVKLGITARIALVLLAVAVLGPETWMLIDASSTNMGEPGFVVAIYVIYVGTLLGCIALLLVTTRAASTITSERERDTWLSLIGTPLSAGEIVAAKSIGSLFAARWIVGIMCLMWLGLAIYMPGVVLFSLPATLLVLTILGVFCTQVGMQFSLRAKTSMRAMGGSAAVVCILGGGYLMCCLPGVFLVSAGGSEELAMMSLAPCMPYLIGGPTVAGLLVQQGEHFDPEGFALVAAHIVGLAGYATLAGVIAMATVAQFDQLAGRVVERLGAVGGRTQRANPTSGDA